MDFSEAGKHVSGSKKSETWSVLADGTVNWETKATSDVDSSGEFFYHDYRYEESHSEGSFTSEGVPATFETDSSSDHTIEIDESFNWKETKREYQKSVDGKLETWSSLSGSGAASGTFSSANEVYYRHEWQRSDGSGNSAGGWNQSEGGWSSEDSYKLSGTWSNTTKKDGSSKFDIDFKNHAKGSTDSSMTTGWNTWSSWLEEGSGSGSGQTRSTSSGFPLTTYPSSSSYERDIESDSYDPNGYNSGRYNWPSYGGPSPGLPHSGGESGYSTDGSSSNGGTASGSGSGSSNGSGTTEPEIRTARDWFNPPGVLQGPGQMLSAGARQPVGFEQVQEASIEQSFRIEKSAYDNSTYAFLGENIIRPGLTDEWLVQATDTELFLVTARFATTVTIGAIYAPGALAVGLVKGAVQGAGMGAGMNVFQQLVIQGKSWEEFDVQQMNSAAYAGAMNGLINGGTGTGYGGSSAFARNLLCKSGKIFDAAESMYLMEDAAGSFQEGDYVGGSFELGAGLLFAYSSYSGTCFVAGTEVVLYEIEGPTAPHAHDAGLAGLGEDDESETTSWITTGVFLVGVTGVVATGLAERRRQKYHSQHEKWFAEAKEEEMQPHEEVTDVEDQPSADHAWSAAALDEAWSMEEDLETLFPGSPQGRKIGGDSESPRFGDFRTAEIEEDDTEASSNLPCPAAESGGTLNKTERTAVLNESSDRQTETGRAAGSRRLTRYGLLASLLCILASGAIWFWQSGPPLPAAQAAHSPANSLSVDAPADPIRITKKIEDLRVGDWVLAKNPQLELEEPSEEMDVSHPENLRALSLRLLKDDGTWLHLELLRTAKWAKENERLGKIFVYFEELGIEGWADLLSIAPCPQISERPHEDCRLLTGRFIHQAANAFDLTIVDEQGQGQAKIGVTGNHPVWSEDRQDFVRVDMLAIGEHLRDTQDRLLQVGSIEPRAGPGEVYNLEVDVEHVYFVSSAGVLVHNASKYGDADNAKKPKVAIHETDGDVILGEIDLGDTKVAFTANQSIENGVMTLNKLHIQEVGGLDIQNQLGRKPLIEAAKEYGLQNGVKEVVIQGGERARKAVTTPSGKTVVKPNRIPKPFRISVE